MPQFPVPEGKKVGEVVSLTAEEAKHLIRVLRAKVGDPIFVYNHHARFEAEIVRISNREAKVRLLKALPPPALQGEVILGQALLKKDKMEWIIQKAVELGVSEVIPFRSERTVPTGEKAEPILRWQKIADEALKQCGRTNPMTVASVKDFSNLIQTLPLDATKILFHEGGIQLASLSPKNKIVLLVGSEGGFAPQEVEAAKGLGFIIGNLGSLTLRAETAAITAIVITQHGLGNI